MGRIDAIIPDDLEKKLRLKAVEAFGGKKGSLTDALQRAIERYVEEEEKRRK
jgi:hypothetical protein